MPRKIVAALILLPLTLGLLGGCRKKPKADLVLVSPHSEYVQREFETAFSAWHNEVHGRPVKLEWRDIGGTTQITQFIKSAGGSGGMLDVYFGGGAPDHQFLASNGLLERVTLPAETMEQLPDKLTGVRQYDAQGYWYGACVSTFGILYNTQVLQLRGLQAPASWADLAGPAMFGNVVAAGPNSGSARAAYDMIIQTAPDWPAGWAKLLKFWGNCQNFTEGASNVVADVGNGQAAAGTAIDYYAWSHMRAQPGLTQFVRPSDGTVYTPDPISVLKGAPHREMAERFVQFVLSPRGQALWCLPAGQPGGPREKALFRQPVRRDTYQAYAGKMLPELMDIYAGAAEVSFDERVQAARVTFILPDLMRAAAVTNADRLRNARKVLLDKGEPADLSAIEFARLPDNLATLEAMLATADQIAKAKEAGDDMVVEKIAADWADFFRLKYDAIIDAK